MNLLVGAAIAGLTVCLFFASTILVFAFSFGWLDTPVRPVIEDDADATIMVQMSENPTLPEPLPIKKPEPPPTLRPRFKKPPPIPIRSLADRKELEINHHLEIL